MRNLHWPRQKQLNSRRPTENEALLFVLELNL